MSEEKRATPFPLRLKDEVREQVGTLAKQNRRSQNAEIGLLIEEGLRWREMKSGQAVA